MHYYSVVLLPFVGCLYGLESAVAAAASAQYGLARRARGAHGRWRRCAGGGVTKRTAVNVLQKPREAIEAATAAVWRCCRFAEAAVVAVCEYVLWLHSGEADVQGGRETLIVVDVNTLCPVCMYYSYYIAYILMLYCSSGLSSTLPQML